jgi:hypothetical protein
MSLPLQSDFFSQQPLSDELRETLITIAHTACCHTVQNAMAMDAHPIVCTLSNRKTMRRAQIRKGIDIVDPSLDAMSSYTQLKANLEEVADFFYLDTKRKMHTFVRVLGNSIIDKVNLYTLVDRPSTHDAFSKLHYIGIEWEAVEYPFGFRNRDMCYIECHDEFDFFDESTQSKRRGWVCLWTSYIFMCLSR